MFMFIGPGVVCIYVVLWGSVLHSGTDADLSQKGSHTKAQAGGFWSKAQQESVSRLAALNRCLCTYAEGQRW